MFFFKVVIVDLLLLFQGQEVSNYGVCVPKCPVILGVGEYRKKEHALKAQQCMTLSASLRIPSASLEAHP